MSDGPVPGADPSRNGHGPVPAAVPKAAGTGARRPAEAEVDAVRRDEQELRSAARRILGNAAVREVLPFGPALRASGGSWTQPCLLWLLALADAAVAAGLILAAPQAALSGGGVLRGFAQIRVVALGLGAAGGLVLLRRGLPRRSAARGAALASGAAVAAIGLSTSTVALVIASITAGLASGALVVVLLPLLVDAHRPELRVRAVGGLVCASVTGVGLAGAVLSVTEGAGGTWRLALMIIGVLPLGAALLCRGLAEAPVGRHDQDRIARLVESHLGGPGGAGGDLHSSEVELAPAERFRRVTAPAGARAALAVVFAAGLALWGLIQPLEILWRDRWDLASPSQVVLLSVLWLVCVPGVLWFSRHAEVAFRRSPAALASLVSSVGLTGAACLAVAAAAPAFAISVALLVVSFAVFGCLLVAGAFLLVSLCEPGLRGEAGLLVGVTLAAGGLIGPQLAGTVGDRFGVAWALVILALVPLGAASGIGRAAPDLEADLDGLVGRLIERQELATRISQGHHLPLMSCRRVDFSYGQVQVLFEVSFTVDDGEMVALLGTNGAGKSTLLRLISGLSFPTAGSLHYRGADITFLGPDRRVELGISQIPGGRAVFAPLTVADNLRAFGHMHGRDRSQLERGIEETFAALPRLGERRNQLAATLSGGEQQMLALGKAFILRPRLLLIDELSLGLAPKIVGELLEMVRRINQEGTAVVLVEQSVNVALSVVSHAYFMEKGQMRFDGAAQELLDRPDLLRSVFLQGATKGLEAVAR